MKLYRELDITQFQPWSGAVYTFDKIDAADKLNQLEALLEELYPDGIEETQLNDLLWFDSEWLFECLGIEEEEEEEEDTRFCPYTNDTTFCNGICSKCGNSKI